MLKSADKGKSTKPKNTEIHQNESVAQASTKDTAVVPTITTRKSRRQLTYPEDQEQSSSSNLQFQQKTGTKRQIEQV